MWKFYPQRALPSNFRNNSFRCLDDIECPEAHRRLQDVGDPQKSTTRDETLSSDKTKKVRKTQEHAAKQRGMKEIFLKIQKKLLLMNENLSFQKQKIDFSIFKLNRAKVMI